MWISSYCIAFIYLQNTKVKQLFSPLTYEDSHSPAMKQTIHICGVDNLVEEINNIIQNKQECQTMEYDIQFICCSCKITEIERKCILRKHRKKTYVWQHGTCYQLVYSVLFSVLPVIQSVLAQLLGKAVVVTIIIGDFILTWVSHEQNKRETCFIHLYKAIQIDEWDNIMIINNWKK